MKNNKLLHFFLAVAVLIGIVSCEDREIITVENQAQPIVMDLSAKSLFLDKNFPNNPALTISWSAAEYSVPSEINYKVEVSADEAFNEAVLLTNVNGSQRATVLTAVQMNDAAGKLKFVPDVATKMYIRVSAFLGSAESLKAVSNVTSLMVTPYVLTYPDFYLVGEASYVGWDAAKSQILYKKENLSYIYTYLENGKSFRFLGQQDWNPINYSLSLDGVKAEYRYFKQFTDNLIDDPDNDENIRFTGASGVYKITINADETKQSIEAKASPILSFDIPQVYLVGNVAGNGWSAENAVDMTKTGAGVFEYTTTLSPDAEFKFLGQKSFGDLDWGNITEDGNDGFLGPKGDNGNVKFVGDGSTYKITVNIKAGIYTIVKQ